MNDGKLEVLFLGDSLWSTDGKVHVTILEHLDGITIEIDVGTDLGF